jgi:hypothetical protein
MLVSRYPFLFLAGEVRDVVLKLRGINNDGVNRGGYARGGPYVVPSPRGSLPF